MQMVCQTTATGFRPLVSVCYELQFLAGVFSSSAIVVSLPRIPPGVSRDSYLPLNLPYMMSMVTGAFGLFSPPMSFVLVMDMS